MASAKSPHVTPIPVRRALRVLGEHVSTWRKLNRLTAAQVAERANISRDTLRAIEQGRGTVSTENLLRVLRILGVMDEVVNSADPYETDVGRLRMDETLPQAGAVLMAEREPVEVTVEIDGRETVAGTLWVHERGGQSATFRYADSYLADPSGYALDPALPRGAGVFRSPPGSALFRAFADSAPDRWGENLMRREERERARAVAATPRTLGKADFLLGVRDDTRQGAIRFRRPGTRVYYAAHQHAVPRLIEVARLMRAANRLSKEDGLDRDLADLIAAGSSLGGARPKAAVIDSAGQLTIAKFPRAESDEWDVAGWEEVQLRLARRVGMTVEKSQLLPVAGRHVLLVRRFDRHGIRRIGFASAITMLEASDGEQRSYLEIAEAIERLSPRAEADLRELYRRIVFSILTSNTDDHLRNHAFLRVSGGWVLSPAYDLNPNPDNPARLSTAIDLGDTTASIDLALSVSGYFRLTPAAATLIGWVPTMGYITLTFRSPWQGDLTKCPSLQVKTTDLTLPGELGKRDIVIDTAALFAPTNTALMRRCGDYGCTVTPVPPATCSDASYGYAMQATGPPQHAAYSEHGCDGHWLVLDVGWPGGAAGCDGPSCGQDMAVTHWFFSAGPHGWVTITSSRTAGCTRVHQVEPAFPTKLCATLPAIT